MSESAVSQVFVVCLRVFPRFFIYFLLSVVFFSVISFYFSKSAVSQVFVVKFVFFWGGLFLYFIYSFLFGVIRLSLLFAYLFTFLRFFLLSVRLFIILSIYFLLSFLLSVV